MANASLGTVLRHVRMLAPAQGEGRSDAELLEAFLSLREQTAFAALVRRHGRMVLNLCRRLLRQQQDAEDAFQATFLILARKAAAVHKRQALASWLYGVAYRVALSIKRAAARRRVHEGRARAMSPSDPSADLAWREVQTLLEEEIQRLPEKYRAVFVLCCLESKPRAEIARLLGLKEGTVSSRLDHARKQLQSRLAQRGVTLSGVLAATALTQPAGSAAVPATVLVTTVQAAAALSVGKVIGARIVSARVAALVEGGLKTVFTAKQIALAFVLTFAMVASGTGIVLSQSSTARTPDVNRTEQPPPAAKRPDQPKAAEVRSPPTDHYGDPLPEGAVARLGTLRFRQGGGYVNRLLLTPDGKTLISKSYYGERTVSVWELATGKLLRQFPGHYEQNGAVALSPDGKELAIGQDAVIHFYDPVSGRELRQLKTPLGGTEGLAFSPDGTMLASGHQRQTVILWDLSSAGRELARLAVKHNSLTLLAFSPDGKTLAASGPLDKTIRLFDVATRKQRQHLTRAVSGWDFALSRNAFAFSPNGSTLAMAGEGGTIIALRDVATGKLIRELRGPGKYLDAVAWSADGKILAASSYDGASYYDDKRGIGYIHFWDAATGKERRHIKAYREGVESLAFTSDGRTLVAGGRNSVIRLWDTSTGQEQAPATPSPQANGGEGSGRGLQGLVVCMAQSPDGRTLAFSDEHEIRLWDRTAGRETGTIPGHHWSFAFSPDGKMLAGGAGLNAINLWDVADRRLVRRLQSDPKKSDGYSHVAFSPDGKLLVSVSGAFRMGGGGKEELVVQLWDPATGKRLRRLGLTNRADAYSGVTAIAFSPDGKKLIASGQAINPGGQLLEYPTNKVLVWEVATGKQLARLSAAMNDASDNPPAPANSHLRLRPLALPRIVISRDSKMLSMNRSQKTIPVWEAATGQQRLLLKGHEEATTCVAFSPDGRMLASASWDNTIRLWDLEKGVELRRLTGHRGKAESLVFSVDGKTLISAGDDTTIMFWDVAAITQRVRAPAASLSANEWDALWHDLASADAAKAHRAIATLSAATEQAVSFLQKRLQPARTTDARRIARLINDLDNNNFAQREKATHDLEALGESAEAGLRKALQRQPSPEFRRRAEQVLDSLAIPSGDSLRALRAVEVLEHIGTPGAIKVLEALARGTIEARLTKEAKASLEQLVKRSSPTP